MTSVAAKQSVWVYQRFIYCSLVSLGTSNGIFVLLDFNNINNMTSLNSPRMAKLRSDVSVILTSAAATIMRFWYTHVSVEV
jgi:hypothetical protein